MNKPVFAKFLTVTALLGCAALGAAQAESTTPPPQGEVLRGGARGAAAGAAIGAIAGDAGKGAAIGAAAGGIKKRHDQKKAAQAAPPAATQQAPAPAVPAQ